jgi:hypothetical protein
MLIPHLGCFTMNDGNAVDVSQVHAENYLQGGSVEDG